MKWKNCDFYIIIIYMCFRSRGIDEKIGWVVVTLS